MADREVFYCNCEPQSFCKNTLPLITWESRENMEFHDADTFSRTHHFCDLGGLPYIKYNTPKHNKIQPEKLNLMCITQKFNNTYKGGL